MAGCVSRGVYAMWELDDLKGATNEKHPATTRISHGAVATAIGCCFKGSLT